MRTYCRLFYRIPFSETDAMGIVHHSNHARYLERGRVEFLRQAGLSYSSLIKRGMQYPVLELKTIFKKPLVFDEVILIETAISESSRTRLNFSYKIFSVDEMLQPFLTTETYSGVPKVLAETFHCCVDSQGRPIPAEPEVADRLRMLQEGGA